MKKGIMSIAVTVSILAFGTPAFCLEGLQPSFGFSIGRMSGDTTYQIGNDVVTPAGTERVHFPISELKFPLDVYFLEVEGGFTFRERFGLRARAARSINGAAGKMEDSDWGVYFLEEGPPFSADSLDIFSESDADLTAWIIDVLFRFRALQYENYRFDKPLIGFFFGLGYRYQFFDWTVSNLDQGYPSSAMYFGLEAPHDFEDGLVLTYETTFHVPYGELGVELNLADRGSLTASVGYAPWVKASDVDDHILRSIYSETEADGTALLASVEGRYDFADAWSIEEAHWYLSANLRYVDIDTEGKSATRIYAGPGAGERWTIDQTIVSSQLMVLFTLGYVFSTPYY